MNTNITNFRIFSQTITPTLDTNAYTAGDVLFSPVELNLSPVQVKGAIRHVAILDLDDVGETAQIYFLSSNVSLGTVNSAPNISDANAVHILGYVTVAASQDLGASRFGQAECYIPFDVDGGKIYVSAITTTALTHSASGLRVRITPEIQLAT